MGPIGTFIRCRAWEVTVVERMSNKRRNDWMCINRPLQWKNSWQSQYQYWDVLRQNWAHLHRTKMQLFTQTIAALRTTFIPAAVFDVEEKTKKWSSYKRRAKSEDSSTGSGSNFDFSQNLYRMNHRSKNVGIKALRLFKNLFHDALD